MHYFNKSNGIKNNAWNKDNAFASKMMNNLENKLSFFSFSNILFSSYNSIIDPEKLKLH
jgi:hypothetical protein